MKINNCVNILLGDVGLCSNLNAQHLRKTALKCDIICIYHNFEESDLNSILAIGRNPTNHVSYEDFYKTGSILFAPFFNKIKRLFKKNVNNIFMWYSYFRGNIYLENTSRIRFEIPDGYKLQKQSIDFWEFDMGGCFLNFRRLILANVNFTYFCSINKQISCIKSLRYSIKEIVWKNFISELIFNPQIKLNKIEDDTVIINLSEMTSFIICGKFSNSNLSKDFLTLFGHGELIPIGSNSFQSNNCNFDNYILKSIVFSREDVLYFISVFPVNKVIGPDFNNYLIPNQFIRMFEFHHSNSSLLSNINKIHSGKSSSPKFTKFIFYDSVNITKTSVDPENNIHLQVISF
ncbi:unnamed protein product [Cryptosporidium hominis]|uniref:Uncharacterized protein n=1 Tax=Cryptosporidium hominis TaxID=237895 RepID=A0A0S4TFJ5_CRYHO|nr:hypothetical protein [Cryptosporidium hominis TU502]OLQ16297.1 hypothetical protein ChTU502y2012_374g0300 [Cryptosporidium hominis]PPA64549.1 hypothetical protein ChUKH1_03265 [Cryptosporidium hominis]PPS96731.1 Uncharacterized protein GY17_00001478 [Cryptosporidium hominis]CUV06276.1 unnamed protein product [Cryptosporidium hominis]|eukprot:PPS96731.1 Uncharacterized protein GY17_00001478 [Cryptosporidium hominis]